MNNRDGLLFKSQTVQEYGRRYTAYLTEILSALDYSALDKFIEVLERTRQEERTVFFLGNGGSATTASHWANDLGLGTRVPGLLPFKTVSLTDNVAVITALANDQSYSDIFVGQLEYLFKPKDVLVAISASGNSPNVVRAVDYANAHGGITVGLVGFDGGQVKRICHVCVHIPTLKGEYGPVEDVHLILDHLVTAYVRQSLQRVIAHSVSIR